MVFIWFWPASGISSDLSFGLADYCLVNRPTGPFHLFLASTFFYLLFCFLFLFLLFISSFRFFFFCFFFLLLFASFFFFLFASWLSLKALFAFPTVFLLFCLPCFFRLWQRSRDIARQTLVPMSAFYAIVDQLNCPLGTNGKGTTSTAWRFPRISTSSVFDDDLTRASPIPQANVGEKAPLVTTPTASSPEKRG